MSGGAEGLRFPPTHWGAEMEVGLGEGQGRSRGPACQDLCPWSDPSIRQVLKNHGQDYFVGNKLSKADIHLVELLYYVEELDPSLLANFPLLKVSSPTALGAKHTPHLGICSLDPGTGVLGVCTELFPPSGPVPSLTCWSLSACLSPPPRADWSWLASRITIHIFCLHFQPNCPIFSFSCLDIWHISFPHTALEGEPAGLIIRKFRKLDRVLH